MKARSKTPIAPPNPQEHVQSKHLNRGLVLAAVASIFLVIVLAVWLSGTGSAKEDATPGVAPATTGILENADLPPILREEDAFAARRAALARARSLARAQRQGQVAGGMAAGGGEDAGEGIAGADSLQIERVRALAERLRALQEAPSRRPPREAERREYREHLERRRTGSLGDAGSTGGPSPGGPDADRHREAVSAPLALIAGTGGAPGPPAGESSENRHADLLRAAQQLAASRGDGAMSQMLASLARVYEESESDAVESVDREEDARRVDPYAPEAAGAAPGRFGRRALQLQRPVTPYEVKQGTVIPAILETAINSDVPGGVRGRTTRDVYDTSTQRHILIPKHSTLVGEAGGEQGSDRLAIVWTRVILPDGRSIDLGGQETKDGTGASGLPGDVDSHFLRRFRSAFLVSMVGAGVKIATYDDSQGAFARPRIGQVAGSGAAEQTGEVATELLRRGMNVRPTVRIPPGQAFYVYVNEDMAFEAPYRPADGFGRW